MNTPTPRTDRAVADSDGQWSFELRYCSRQLETELTAVTEQRDGLRSGIDYASDQLTRVTEQRDRLIEVIKAASVLIAAKGRHNTMLAYNGLRDALQSLNQPEPESKDPHRFVIMPDDIDMDDRFFKRLNKTINLNKWQPIETAPKDGTQIMGCDGLNYFICSWGEESLVGSQFKNHGWVTDYDDDGMCFNLESPTHWIPIVPFQQVIQSLNQPTKL